MSYSVEINGMFVKVYKQRNSAIKYARNRANDWKHYESFIRVWESGEGVIWENTYND